MRGSTFHRTFGSIMFQILAALLVVLSACVGSGELDTAVDDSGCLPWTYRPNSTSPCECGSSLHGTMKCNITTGELSLQACFCVTYNPITNESVAGFCPYSCIAHLGEQVYELHITRNNFTDLTCGVWNREGPLCSKCIPGYGIPLYSYDLKCVQVSCSVTNTTNSSLYCSCCLPSQCTSSSMECFCVGSTNTVITSYNAATAELCELTT